MKKLFVGLMLCVWTLGAAETASGAESIVYAIAKVEQPAPCVARLEEGEMCEAIKAGAHQWAEVFSISPDGGQPDLLFTDKGLPFRITGVANSTPGGSVINSHDKLMYSTIYPKIAEATSPVAIYEVHLDGSGHYRKVMDLPRPADHSMQDVVDPFRFVNIRNLFLSPAGDKLGFISNQYLFIYNSKTGELLHKVEMDKISKGCPVEDIGWLNDDRTLFASFGENYDVEENDPSLKMIGTWALQEDGSALKFLAAPLDFNNVEAYAKRSHYTLLLGDHPLMIGQLTNGQYVFDATMEKQGTRSKSMGPDYDFLFLSDPKSGAYSEIHIEHPGLKAVQFHISPSGGSVAYINAATDGYSVKYTLYTRSLKSDQPKQLASVPNSNMALIGWLEK
jgi:hypothetical protein